MSHPKVFDNDKRKYAGHQDRAPRQQDRTGHGQCNLSEIAGAGVGA
jgi:hypothetical protein